MKRDFANNISCLNCSGSLELEQFQMANNEVLEGILFCPSCKTIFPILRGIPRVLNYELLTESVPGFRGFAAEYKDRIKKGQFYQQERYKTDVKIMKGYEYLWNLHSEITDVDKREFHEVLKNVPLSTLIENKLILDVGCGMGRMTHCMMAFKPKLAICVEFGPQIEIAKQNNSSYDNIEYIQINIYDLSFLKIRFDFVYCVGVLHHLPEPKKAAEILYHLNCTSGYSFYWLYGKSKLTPILNLFKGITAIMPKQLLLFFTLIPAVFIYSFVFTSRITSWKLPFHFYKDRNFHDVWTTCFDQLTAGVAYYYNSDDIRDLFHELDYDIVNIHERCPGSIGNAYSILLKKL